MSIGYGIGMLFVGIAAIIVAAIIGYYIINKIKDEDEDEDTNSM